MNLPSFATKRGRVLWQGLLVVLVLLMGAGFLVHGHPHFGFDGWPGFNGWYPFLACVLLVGLARAAFGGMAVAEDDDDD